MNSRKAWKDLSPAYRARLERRGVTSHTHAVADLTQARGHPSAPPPGAAPKDLVEKIVRGQGTRDDLRTLASKFTRPSWVPDWASVDVAAALSRLPNPKRWEDVEFIPRGDGQPWTMIVRLKGNAYDREILIPGGGGPGTGAKEVLEIVSDISKGSQRERQRERVRRRAEAIFFEVDGTDEEEVA